LHDPFKKNNMLKESIFEYEMVYSEMLFHFFLAECEKYVKSLVSRFLYGIIWLIDMMYSNGEDYRKNFGRTHMDFKQIEAFANVVRYKSFSKAADALGVTQPTISTHVSTLEKELKIKLIDRRGKEALATQQGTILFQYAIQLLNTRDKALFSLEGSTAEIDGTLEIHASAIAGEFLVPSLLTEFKTRYPAVRFSLEQAESAKVEENLLGQKAEIGFVGHKGNANLHYQKLFADPLVLITPKTGKFEEIRGSEIGIEDFIEEPFVWRAQSTHIKKEFEEKLLTLDYDPREINVVATVNSAQAIKQAVGKGLGVSLMSKLTLEEESEDRGYYAFPVRELDLAREFYLVWNRNSSLSPTAEKFRTFVSESFPES